MPRTASQPSQGGTGPGGDHHVRQHVWTGSTQREQGVKASGSTDTTVATCGAAAAIWKRRVGDLLPRQLPWPAAVAVAVAAQPPPFKADHTTTHSTHRHVVHACCEYLPQVALQRPAPHVLTTTQLSLREGEGASPAAGQSGAGHTAAGSGPGGMGMCGAAAAAAARGHEQG